MGSSGNRSSLQAQLLPDEKRLDHGFIKWLQATFGWILPKGKVGASTVGTAFVYDEEGNLLGEYDNGSAKNAGPTEYVWLPTPQGQAIPIGMYKNGTFYAVHADHLGTPRLMTDSTNAPVWQWPYSAFGNNKPTGPLSTITTGTQTRLKATVPGAESNLGLPGQYRDAESGLNDNRFRSYWPLGGIYTQMDPIGLAGGLHRPGYVGGNPISFTDANGLQAVPTPWGPMPMPALPTPARGGSGGYDPKTDSFTPAPSGWAIPLPSWLSPKPTLANAFPSGVWPGDKGAAEWGRRNGVGTREGKGRFHGIKQGCGGRGTDNFGVNPDTGDVYDPEGHVVGNLDDVKSK